MGRWLRIDPSGYDAGVNCYAYLSEVPISRVDATGMRPLTPGEVASLRPIFSDSINYSIIVRGGGTWSPFGIAASIAFMNNRSAITMGDTIYVNPSHWSNDYSLYGDRSLLFHEVTHIWQYANRTVGGGVFGPVHVSINSLLRGGDRAYELPPDFSENTSFEKLGFEQQAMVVQEFVIALEAQNSAKAKVYGRVMISGGLLPDGLAASAEILLGAGTV